MDTEAPQAAPALPEAPTRARRRELLAWLSLLLLCGVTYGVVLGFGFVWDDRNLILLNPYLRQPQLLWKAFFADFWTYTHAPQVSGFYRPLVILSYGLEYQLWGTNPMGYHATNLALHGLCVSCVYGLARRWRLGVAAAWCGAAVFALHPVQAAAVGNIASRTDLMATALLLLGLWAWLHPGPWRLLGMLGLWLAPLCKEPAVFGPLLAVAASYTLDQEQRPSRLHMALLVGLGGAGYLALRFGALGLGGAGGPGLGQVPWRGGFLLPLYLLRLLWPSPQSPLTPLAEPTALTVSIGLLVWGLALLALWRTKGLVRFCIGWFLLGILPVAELVPLHVRFSDLLLYLPMAALALLLAQGAQRAHKHRLFWPAVGIACLLWGGLSFRAVRLWKDNATLWKHGISMFPRHPSMNLNYANALHRRGKVREGCVHLQKIRAWMPGSTRVHFNLGNCARRSGQLQAAAKLYGHALRLSGGRMHQARYNLALTWLQLKRLDLAVKHAEQLTQRAPGLASSWKLLGVTCAQSGQFRRAAQAFQRALRLRPHDRHAAKMLRAALSKLRP